MPKFNFDLKNFSKSEKKEFNLIVNRLFDLYKDLYELSNNVDLQKITFVQASLECNKIKGELKINIEKLNKINASKNLEFIYEIKNTYIRIVEILDNLIIRLLEDGKLNYLIKQSECEVMQNLYILTKSL